jgi:hypothetical protein
MSVEAHENAKVGPVVDSPSAAQASEELERRAMENRGWNPLFQPVVGTTWPHASA